MHVIATSSSPLQHCGPCFVWKDVEERRQSICHSHSGFPVFRESAEQPIALWHCQYIILEKKVSHLKHTVFSFQRTLSKPPGASVFTEELEKYPTMQYSFPSPYSWENDGQTIPIKLLVC